MGWQSLHDGEVLIPETEMRQQELIEKLGKEIEKKVPLYEDGMYDWQQEDEIKRQTTKWKHQKSNTNL